MMNMSPTVTVTLPPEPLLVIQALIRAGYQAYLVGGSVRDMLLSQLTQPARQTSIYLTDYDITTNATPEQIQAVFDNSFYENKFGTVSLTYQHIWDQFKFSPDYQKSVIEAVSHYFLPTSPRLIDLQKAKKIHSSLQTDLSNKSSDQPQPTLQAPEPNQLLPSIEITTYRCQEEYGADHRRPIALCWGTTLEEDLSRRDFTVNALAIDFDVQALDNLPEPSALSAGLTDLKITRYQLIDHHHGWQDLQSGLIDTVGDPDQRFHEDALRMLRAIRLSVQLNFQLADRVIQAIKTQANLMTHISGERIRDEFLKMLISDYPKAAIELMDDTGLLTYVLPELLTAKGVKQGGHHTTDVWTHSLDALAACPSPDPIVRLATLLHDIDKPATYQEVDGKPTFYGHEVVGARTAVKIARRLKLSARDCERIFILVRYHMFHYQVENSDASIRRFMRKVGLANIDDILDLREADRLGSGARQTSWRLEEMKQRMIEQLNQPMDVTDLAIDGHDLMAEFSLPPGPKIGQILSQLFEQVLEKPELNDRSSLMVIAKKLL